MAAGAQRVVVMGVSGSGKSSVGAALAARLGVPFVDADDLHPASNRLRMSAGTPLTDEERWPWLDAVAARLSEASGGVVIACSALRRAYRDRLRAGAPDLALVYLDVPRSVLQERLEHRRGHFMPASLLGSQLETLEPPTQDEHPIVIAAMRGVDAAVDEAVQRLGVRGPGSTGPGSTGPAATGPDSASVTP